LVKEYKPPFDPDERGLEVFFHLLVIQHFIILFHSTTVEHTSKDGKYNHLKFKVQNLVVFFEDRGGRNKGKHIPVVFGYR